MRIYLEVILAFATCLFSYKFGYIEGLKENYFDRELAQIKIDQCFEAIGKK
jgi:hypothetical protein